MMDFSNIYLIA